jgi:transcriptional regulator with XRE-family HTH domain
VDQSSRLRLAKVVKEARGSFSQREFAEQLGVGQTSIQRWEKADSQGQLTLESLEKLAARVEMNPEALVAYLYGRELRTRSLEEVIEKMPQTLLPLVLRAVSQRLRELTTQRNGAVKETAPMEMPASMD